MGDWSKMVEQKEMHSFSPVRAPKSQLAIENPLTGGLWNSPEKDTRVQRQRRSYNKTVGGEQSN